jgi:hypothetical protein
MVVPNQEFVGNSYVTIALKHDAWAEAMTGRSPKNMEISQFPGLDRPNIAWIRDRKIDTMTPRSARLEVRGF